MRLELQSSSETCKSQETNLRLPKVSFAISRGSYFPLDDPPKIETQIPYAII
jgi:hypothetical protein